MNITGWIQTSDYSSTELGAVSFEQAADAVLSFPWDQRLHAYAERVLRREGACPPGIGFNSGEKDTFHVYAVVVDEWQLFVNLSRPGNILGLIRKPSTTLHVGVKTLGQAVALLRLFFDRENEKLVAEAVKFPSREAVPPMLG